MDWSENLSQPKVDFIVRVLTKLRGMKWVGRCRARLQIEGASNSTTSLCCLKRASPVNNLFSRSCRRLLRCSIVR